jgi:O-antigen ligase
MKAAMSVSGETAAWPRARPAAAARSYGLLVGTGAFVLVVAIGGRHGGYFPTTWGWAALGLAWAAGIALITRARIHFQPIELLACAAFGAYVLWVGLSVAWTESVSRSVLEVERDFVYLTGLVALFAVARRAALRYLLGGLLAGVGVLSTYALATRVFPERLGSFDPVSTYRLGGSLGYWNALGIFAVMGIFLAVGFTAGGKRAGARALSAALLVPLFATLFFTYSRGAWIALVVGIVAAIAFGRNRLRLVTAMLVVAPAPAIGVWLASRASALTHIQASLVDASTQGHRLALELLALTVVAAACALALAWCETRVSVPSGVRRVYVATLLVAVLAGLSAVFVHYGDPVTIARTAYRDFTGSANPRKGTALNTRLFSLWGNGRPDMWRIAWRDAKSHPWAGSGAGTYEFRWARDRPYGNKVLDAHSLYAETLAELGPVGLIALVVALCVPLAALPRARAHPLGIGAFAAYVAFLFHAGVDWDWEMPVVTLAALLCGGALLLAARRNDVRTLTTPAKVAGIALVLCLSGAALVGQMGNNALADGAAAASAHRWPQSEADAQNAMRWARWSSDPWQMAGEAQLARHRLRQARRSFRTAIRKDPRDWELWIDLALASSQPERRRAALVALRLNPLSPEIAASHPLLGLGP